MSRRLTWRTEGLRFSWLEFSGSLGDLGTFLPLAVAMTISCQLDFGLILVCAGLMNVLTGWLFRQPIPVQPMKAIAAVAITEGLLGADLMAAGLLMGLLMVGLALSGTVDWIDRRVPTALVRGIQLGVGLKLAWRGLIWVFDLPVVAWDGLLVAALAALLLFGLRSRRHPVLLYVFLGGFLLPLLDQPGAYGAMTLAPAIPELPLHWPTAGSWSTGLLTCAIPQTPLTLLNSVVAVCALSADYFPGRGISPRRMAASVGLMNLVCAPLGGIPMCHGAGGLAAQHRFGARTGGSVVILGLLKAVAGLLFGGALLGLLSAYPMAILGPMLVFAGLELTRPARKVRQIGPALIMLTTATLILFVNTLAGFLAGLAAHLGIRLIVWLQVRTARPVDAGGHPRPTDLELRP